MTWILLPPVGGDVVVIAFNSVEKLQLFLREEWRILQHIIYKVLPLSIDFVPKESIQYLDFIGLPPTIVTKTLIRGLAARFGKMICLECDLGRLGRLDMVSCLMSVPFDT